MGGAGGVSTGAWGSIISPLAIAPLPEDQLIYISPSIPGITRSGSLSFWKPISQAHRRPAIFHNAASQCNAMPSEVCEPLLKAKSPKPGRTAWSDQQALQPPKKQLPRSFKYNAAALSVNEIGVKQKVKMRQTRRFCCRRIERVARLFAR